jgi:hypothetical protein
MIDPLLREVRDQFGWVAAARYRVKFGEIGRKQK